MFVYIGTSSYAFIDTWECGGSLAVDHRFIDTLSSDGTRLGTTTTTHDMLWEIGLIKTLRNGALYGDNDALDPPRIRIQSRGVD